MASLLNAFGVDISAFSLILASCILAVLLFAAAYKLVRLPRS